VSGAASSRNWLGANVLVLSPTPTHPQDSGGRKRIFEICRRLSDEGARVTFVHYAAEPDWQGRLPWYAERAMAGAWSQYYTIAPSRRLHVEPIGEEHAIDEWWDPAIEHFLRWLFSVQSFDAFIVNHSWLSKAFEFAPVPVFRILDAHERFSGRREIAAMQGARPESFCTTEAEEKIALARAQLVWASGEEEGAAFRRMTQTPVVTIPHAGATHAVGRPLPDPDGYLRVGIIAAASDANRANITRFVETAEPVFREAFAPIKLLVAGSVCGVLGRMDYPFLELLGPLENVDDFYHSIDCVAIPTEISTGMKARTAEAISLGVPVVSTAHAFEGFAPSGSLQGLANFEELAGALCDLAFAPRGELDALAAASRSAQVWVSAEVDKAFSQTVALMRDCRRTIVLAVDSRAFVPDNIFNLALASLHDELRPLASLTVLVAAGSAQDVVRNPAMVDRFRRVVVGGDIAGVERMRERLAAVGADVHQSSDFLRMMQPKIVIADALNPAMFVHCCPDAVVITRTEMVAFSEGSAEFDVPGARYRRAFAAAPAQSREVSGRMAVSGAEPVLEPCLSPSAIGLSPDFKREDKMVALLGSPRAPAMAIAARMAQSWGLKPLIVHSIGERFPAELDGISCVRADAHVRAILKRIAPLPEFAVDLSAGAIGLPLCREVLERLHVPTLCTAPANGDAVSAPGIHPLRAQTEGDLWCAFRSFATAPRGMQHDDFSDFWQTLDKSDGRTWLWRYCMRLFEAEKAQRQ
jgi:hypothetical protein